MKTQSTDFNWIGLIGPQIRNSKQDSLFTPFTTIKLGFSGEMADLKQ